MAALKNCLQHFKKYQLMAIVFFFLKECKFTGKETGAKIRAHIIMWALIMAPDCLQCYKSTDRYVS